MGLSSLRGALTVAVLAGGSIIAGLAPSSVGAAVTVGGPFELAAPDGRLVTDRSFNGKWLLVYFGYTSCPNSCPTALAAIAATLEKLGADADRVQALFITLDPARDTRDVMGDYVLSFDRRILGLTGTPSQIATVAQAYGAYAERHESGPGGRDDLIDHSVYVYVMDPRGGFARAFDPSWTADRMAGVLRGLMGSRAALDDAKRLPDRK